MNIDMSPEAIRMFKKERPKDINVLCGVTAIAGEREYFSFSDPAVNSFDATQAERWMHKDWIQYLGKQKIQTYPLKEIIMQYLLPNQQINLLSVDVEGYDLEVLQSNDWIAYRPLTIVVEDHNFNFREPQKSHIYAFLIEKDYVLYSRSGPSLFFLDARASVSMFGV